MNGDPTRLQQVLWNLLANAVKFAREAGHIRVAARGAGPDVEISVTDDGEGIAPEFLPQVFSRFRQADNSSARRHGGLGLGLAIVKQLVELHGGQVSARSRGLGQGATFVVTLPLQAQELGQRHRYQRRLATPRSRPAAGAAHRRQAGAGRGRPA